MVLYATAIVWEMFIFHRLIGTTVERYAIWLNRWVFPPSTKKATTRRCGSQI